MLGYVMLGHVMLVNRGGVPNFKGISLYRHDSRWVLCGCFL
jgi:hypothetical protein